MVNRISNQSIINSFCDVVPFLNELFEEDVSYAMTDTEKYILSVNGKDLRFQIKEGDPIPEGGAVKEALKTGSSVIKDIPKEIYGTPFRSYAIPMKECGEIVGVFVMGKSFARKEHVLSIAQNISSAIHETSDAVKDLVTGIKQTELTNTSLLDTIRQAQIKTDETNKIIAFIQEISIQTYILGVNASIDAAKAGIYGKSFGVVAQEIERLSRTINESIARIDSTLNFLATSITLVTNGLTESTEVFNQQTKDLDQIADVISGLKESSIRLEKLSESL